jgi:hypothetical protein
MESKNTLPPQEIEVLMKTLKKRFENNLHRHKKLEWNNIQEKLEANPEKLWSLNQMEKTGGEPDVVDYDEKANEYVFCDCSPESPKERRSLCYDREALESRKKYPPKTSAMDMAAEMGIEILNEVQYEHLQSLENFDKKTSSWLKTPDEVRRLGGAIFGDFRFGRVFIYHNGADSYYGARGFRALLRL